MSNYDPNASAPGFSANGATAIDVGLRALMLRVYNYMGAGVGVIGVAAFLTFQFTGPELLQSPLMWVFMLAPVGLVFFISARINTLSVEAARGLFFLYAALVGISLSTIFHIYTQSSITRVFFISAAAFGAQHLGLHYPAKLIGIRNFPVHGPDRYHYRKPGQSVSEIERARLGDFHYRRWRLCGPHGLRYPADQGDVRPRR